jgi:aldose 1-epimerase
MAIEKKLFGRFWNQDVHCYTLANRGGVRVKLLDYGAIINVLEVPGRDGAADIILGFDTLYGYLQGHPFFGAVAGRVANRIPDGRFSLDGREYLLGVNAPFDNHLHGGFRGFDKYVWQSSAYEQNGNLFVRLTRVSPDGEEGYPGNLDATITYSLSQDNVFGFEVSAVTDEPTIVNVVQHSYFNLAGHDRGDVRGHELTIEADAVTPVDERLLPTGEIMDVTGTPFDFRNPTVLDSVTDRGNGVFDINYVLRSAIGDIKSCARLRDPYSGRTMAMATNMPGLQFYNGHKIYDQHQVGKGGCRYPAWGGLCLETQAFPNAVNHSHFPSMVLRPGEIYNHHTSYTFSVE